MYAHLSTCKKWGTAEKIFVKNKRYSGFVLNFMDSFNFCNLIIISTILLLGLRRFFKCSDCKSKNVHRIVRLYNLWRTMKSTLFSTSNLLVVFSNFYKFIDHKTKANLFTVTASFENQRADYATPHFYAIYKWVSNFTLKKEFMKIESAWLLSHTFVFELTRLLCYVSILLSHQIAYP